MDTRLWIRKYGKIGYSPEEVADIMYLSKGQRSMIADGKLQVVEENIYDNGGHVFRYVTPTKLSEKNRHGDYVKKFKEELTDSQRSKIAESLFNMHTDEVLRLRKRKSATPIKRTKKRKLKSCGCS